MINNYTLAYTDKINHLLFKFLDGKEENVICRRVTSWLAICLMPDVTAAAT